MEVMGRARGFDLAIRLVREIGRIGEGTVTSFSCSTVGFGGVGTSDPHGLAVDVPFFAPGLSNKVVCDGFLFNVFSTPYRPATGGRPPTAPGGAAFGLESEPTSFIPPPLGTFLSTTSTSSAILFFPRIAPMTPAFSDDAIAGFGSVDDFDFFARSDSML